MRSKDGHMQLHRLVIALLISYAVPAVAELGGTPLPATPGSDAAPTPRVALRQINRTDRYSVQETQLPSGTLLREYIEADSKVFAVVWEGPVLPDLQQLLGAYFPAYLEVARSGQAGRGPLTINRSDLVVESSGRMRAFFGRAYVPQLLPQGIAVDVIQ
jgi:uncharacterized protein DUF2844